MDEFQQATNIIDEIRTNISLRRKEIEEILKQLNPDHVYINKNINMELLIKAIKSEIKRLQFLLKC